MKTILSTAAFTALATPAFAHAGHHEFAGWQQAVAHLVESPFHVALLVAGTAGFCALLGYARLRKNGQK